MITTAFKTANRTVKTAFESVGAYIALTDHEQNNGLIPGEARKRASIWADPKGDRAVATCIMAHEIYKVAGADSQAMPSYYLIKEAATGGDIPLYFVKKIAKAIGTALGRALEGADSETHTKIAASLSTLAIPFASGAANLTPDLAKMLALLSIGVGGLGGAAIYHADDSTGRANAKVDTLRRQAEVYRKMRQEIDDETRNSGLLNVDVK